MNIIEQQLLSAKWGDDFNRRTLIAKLIDYYENNQEKYLKAALTKSYPKTAKSMFSKYKYTYPLTNRIFDDISILFNNPVKIKTDKETLEESLEDIISGAKTNAVLAKVNLLVNLTHKVGVIPVWRNEKVELDIITGDTCFIIQDEDNPTQIKELYYQVAILINTPGKLQSVQAYVRWTNETQSIVDVDNGTGNIQNERDIVDNKYGEIPVVWFENDIPIKRFWYDKRNHIVDTNEMVNCELTNFRYILAFQAFSTLVEIGNDDKSTKPFGPSFSLRLPYDPSNPQQKPDAKYITPSPALEKIWKVIMDIIIGAAQAVGISAEAYRRENSTLNSGYQLKLSKADILKKTIADRPFYRESIKKLVGFMTTLFTQNNTSKTFDGAEFSVDFGEVIFDENPKEKEEIRAMRKANGTANIIDFIMEDNPDIKTRKDAIDVYKERQKEVEQFPVGSKLEDAINE